MSSIYQVGCNVVCPASSLHGDKGGVVGSIQSFRIGSNVPFVKWEDGIEGYVKQQHLITQEKYNQLKEAGFDDKSIAEYVVLFNGNIYN